MSGAASKLQLELKIGRAQKSDATTVALHLPKQRARVSTQRNSIKIFNKKTAAEWFWDRPSSTLSVEVELYM